MPNWSESRRSGQLSRGIGVSAGQVSQHQDLGLVGGGRGKGGEGPARGQGDDEVHEQQRQAEAVVAEGE